MRLLEPVLKVIKILILGSTLLKVIKIITKVVVIVVIVVVFAVFLLEPLVVWYRLQRPG